MNQSHREAIDLYCEHIVPRINLNTLWPKLLENKIFNRDDVNVPRWKENLTEKSTVREIYLTVKTRGPYAFSRFVASLKQSGHESLADILEGRKCSFPDKEGNDNEGNVINKGAVGQRNFEYNTERVPDNFFYDIQLSNIPLQIQVRKATEFLDGPVYENVERYPMRSKPRGLVLIITNIHYKYSHKEARSSAAHDEQNIKHLFEEMGFQVISHFDLTKEQFVEKVREFSQQKHLRKVDSCFVIISSHGNVNSQYEVTEIECVDNNPEGDLQNAKTVLCKDILEYFTAEACPRLAGKPKVFIFQLCRGEKIQKSVKEPRHTTDISNFHSIDEMISPKVNCNETIRNYEDIIVAQATLPGYVAFRDKITGSWFIQILCEVFMNYAWQSHLQDLFTMVYYIFEQFSRVSRCNNDRWKIYKTVQLYGINLQVDARLKIQRTTKEECQTLTVTLIGFNKHCFLNPGLFEET